MWNSLFNNRATQHWTGKGVAVGPEFGLIDRYGEEDLHIRAIGVPISGHMMVSRIPYAEKPGAGGRLGPFALNIAGIVSAASQLANSIHDFLTSPQPVPSANLRPRESRLTYF